MSADVPTESTQPEPVTALVSPFDATPAAASPFATAAPAVTPREPKPPREKKPKDAAQSRYLRNLGFIIGGLLLALSLAAGGVVAGWASANRLVVAEQPNSEPEILTIALPDYEPGESVRMPDVRGLDQDRAEQALADAGVPVGVISVTSRPAAGLPGVVIQQTPVFGTANPTAAQIVISQPAVMPDAVGLPAAGVISTLQAFGARVQQVKAYVPGATVGTVVSIDAPAGSTVPATVTVVIADSPSTLALSQLSTSSGSASGDSDVLVSGVNFAEALSLSTSSSASTTSWSLSAKVTLVQGSLGIEDGTDTDFRSLVVVSIDGRELGRYTLAPGAAVPFSFDVTGGTTLSIERTRLTNDSGKVLLLSPTLLGTYDALAQLD